MVGLKKSAQSMRTFLLPHADRFPKFFLTGGVGFLVDAGIFAILVYPLSVSVYLARILSFAVAVSVTWYLNRTYTFADRSHQTKVKSEYTRYFGVQVVGILLNYGVFAASLQFIEGIYGAPLIALTVGSAVAMLFNYIGAHYVAFPGGDRP